MWHTVGWVLWGPSENELDSDPSARVLCTSHPSSFILLARTCVHASSFILLARIRVCYIGGEQTSTTQRLLRAPAALPFPRQQGSKTMIEFSGPQTIEKHITLKPILKLSGSLSGSVGSRIHTPLKLNATFRLSDPFDSYNIRKG